VAAQRRAARAILRRPDPEVGEDFDEVFGREQVVVTPDGAHLAVEVIEPGNPLNADVTIVFSHGYALDRTTFHYQARDLRDLARLVLWDQRGHGRSGEGPRENYTIERLAGDLATVIDAVAPTGPLVLVGHSMGGMELIELASQRPELFDERVVGVMLLATAATHGEESQLAIAGPIGQAVHRVGPVVAGFLGPRPKFVERSLRLADDLVVVLTEHYGFGSAAPPSMVEYTKAMHSRTPIEVLVALLPVFDRLDLRADLGPLQRTDVVIVVGETDRMAPVSLSKELLRLLPGADLVTLADTGHMLMMERYPEVNQQVRDLVHRVRQGLRAA
jgi:pimeloyl-ACP methyl ester carboxylesterase